MPHASQPELSPSAFVPTREAAARLGVDRAYLDRVAPLVARVRPDLVFRVGGGRARRHFRWRADRLPEALNAVEDAPPEPHPRTAEARKKARTSTKLRSLLR